MSPAPSVNDLRQLALLLPPNERVMGAEVADLLGALVAVVHHGPQLLEAVKDGSEGIASFFHGKSVDAAVAAGEPEPARYPVSPSAPTPAPGSVADPNVAALTAQVAQLTQVVTALAQGNSGAHVPADPASVPAAPAPQVATPPAPPAPPVTPATEEGTETPAQETGEDAGIL